MLPITLLAAQKVADLLNANGSLQMQITGMGESIGVVIPVIEAAQVVVTAASPDIGDKDVQLTYPRICLYTGTLKNTQHEKFRSLSGSIAVIADVWASSDLVSDADQWIHVYVQAMTNILRQNLGDLGDGLYFGGGYEVQFQAPKAGGLGYVESARVSFLFTVSQN